MNIKPSWLKLHRAIHSEVDSVTISERTYPITRASNGCRQARFQDNDLGPVTLMAQNPAKASVYAERARKGETLTWVIPKQGSWILIDEPVKKEVLNG